MAIVWPRSSTAHCAQTLKLSNGSEFLFITHLSLIFRCGIWIIQTYRHSRPGNEFGRRVICPAIMLAHWYVLTTQGRLQGLDDNFDDAIPGGCVIGTWALDAARIHLHTERNWILWA